MYLFLPCLCCAVRTRCGYARSRFSRSFASSAISFERLFSNTARSSSRTSSLVRSPEGDGSSSPVRSPLPVLLAVLPPVLPVLAALLHTSLLLQSPSPLKSSSSSSKPKSAGSIDTITLGLIHHASTAPATTPPAAHMTSWPRWKYRLRCPSAILVVEFKQQARGDRRV